MKKVTLNGDNCRLLSLTELTAKMQKMPYKQRGRPAQSHGGDPVYSIYDEEVTKFLLEYCQKVRKADGKRFVNWARVTGPDHLVDRFLRAVGHIDYREEVINQVEIPQL